MLKPFNAEALRKDLRQAVIAMDKLKDVFEKLKKDRNKKIAEFFGDDTIRDNVADPLATLYFAQIFRRHLGIESDVSNITKSE